jgi:hypothetical protein
MVVVAWLPVGAAGRAGADVSSSSIGRALLALQSHTIHTIEPIDADVHLAAAVVGARKASSSASRLVRRLCAAAGLQNPRREARYVEAQYAPAR